MDNSSLEISKEAALHLKKADPKPGRLIARMGALEREIIANPFIALAANIEYQQLGFVVAEC